MEDKGYTLLDATSQFATYDFVGKVYIALSSDESYQIEFYQISDEANAISFFENNKQLFEESKGSSVVETSLSLGNNDKYTLETDGMYKVVSRIDNTVMYINVDSENKTTVKAILDEFNY